MASIGSRILVVFFVCILCSAAGQPVLENYPVLQETNLLRRELVKVAQSQEGVREKTGNNDGPEIRMYLREVGLPEGYPYCAAGMAWCHNQVGIPNPESAWSPDWFRTNVVYRRHHIRIEPFVSRPGQVAGFYSESKKRVSHVGMIFAEGKLHYYTTEFNTNGAGSDEGQGVRSLIRRKESVHVIADYAGYKEIKKAMKK